MSSIFKRLATWATVSRCIWSSRSTLPFLVRRPPFSSACGLIDTATIHATTSTGHIDTGAIPEATLVAGYQLVIPLPLEGAVYERYIGVQAIIGTATTSAGAYSAFLTFDPAGWKSYADATN
jgi:hypothetical protein